MVKAAEGGHDLSCGGLNFVALVGVARLLDTLRNIVEVSQVLFPLLAGWAPPFKEMLNWIQLYYTADSKGAYVAPASTVLVPSVVSEGDPIFP